MSVANKVAARLAKRIVRVVAALFEMGADGSAPPNVASCSEAFVGSTGSTWTARCSDGISRKAQAATKAE